MSDHRKRLLAKYGTGRHGHAHYAPSSAAGWLNCAGFLLANASLTDMAGADAAYGTVAHALAELWRIEGGRPQHTEGSVVVQDGYNVLVNDTMLDYIEQFITWCDEVEGDAFVEQKVDLSEYLPIPDQRGTADHFVCAPGRLTVTDLKMGTGIKVMVENNPQAMLYALGAFTEWDWAYNFQTIVIRICQPRLGYFGSWECSRAELLAFAEHVRERALLAWDENATRTPGEKQCQWCRAKASCPALALHLDALVDDAFEVEDDTPATYSAPAMNEAVNPTPPVPNVKGLSTEALAYRLSFRKVYEKWFAAIYAELLDQAERGLPVPGWKLAQGRRSFDWRDQDEAAAKLVEAGLPDSEVWVTELTSVGKARKALGAKRHKPKEVEAMPADVLVVKPGKPTLVRVSDERQDANDGVDDAFEAEDDGL